MTLCKNSCKFTSPEDVNPIMRKNMLKVGTLSQLSSRVDLAPDQTHAEWKMLKNT